MQTFEFQIDWGLNALLRLLNSYHFHSVLDVGSGSGEHARLLRHFGKRVCTVDQHETADIQGDFLSVPFEEQFDALLCSHVLEHQRNVGLFLEQAFDLLKEDGVLVITVPTHPAQRLVSGHLTSWNAGLLCYNLILAGFNCHDARILKSDELSLIVRKQSIDNSLRDQTSAHGRVEELAAYFPFEVKQGGFADVTDVNWGEKSYELPTPTTPGNIRITSKEFELVADYARVA